MTDHDKTDSISRRNVLKTASTILAGSTVVTGLGVGRGAAETEESIQVEVREMTEEYVAVEVWFPDDTLDGVEFPDDIFLGLADEFVIHDDAVSLPENTEGFANPVEVDPENPALLYFRTRDVDFQGEGEEVTLGLGVFPERTIPDYRWDSCPGHRDY